MDKGQLLELLKIKLGISSDLRDKALEKIIASIITELTDNYGVVLDNTRADHEMFIVDFAAYRYEGVADNGRTMPRHLQWRLHNLQLGSGRKNEQKNKENQSSSID